MAIDNVNDVTEQTWKDEVFPEWGTWLNEEIERTTVLPGTFELWWLVNMGIWFKSDQQTSLAIDLWAGTGKQTHDVPEMSARHQWARLTGGGRFSPTYGPNQW